MTIAQTAPKRARPWDWLVVPALAVAILGFDQFTKYLVRTNLGLYDVVAPLPSLSHLFTFTFVTNTGAAFGFFPDRSLFFVIVAILVSLGIVLYLRHVPSHEWLLKLSLAMQLGGALGNLFDRIRLGYVVDFVDFRAWPVFNFSDTFIVVGVILLAYRLILHPDPFLLGGAKGDPPLTNGASAQADGSPPTAKQSDPPSDPPEEQRAHPSDRRD